MYTNLERLYECVEEDAHTNRSPKQLYQPRCPEESQESNADNLTQPLES